MPDGKATIRDPRGPKKLLQLCLCYVIVHTSCQGFKRHFFIYIYCDTYIHSVRGSEAQFPYRFNLDCDFHPINPFHAGPDLNTRFANDGDDGLQRTVQGKIALPKYTDVLHIMWHSS